MGQIARQVTADGVKDGVDRLREVFKQKSGMLLCRGQGLDFYGGFDNHTKETFRTRNQMIEIRAGSGCW